MFLSQSVCEPTGLPVLMFDIEEKLVEARNGISVMYRHSLCNSMQQQQQKTRLRVKQKNEINKEYNNFPVHGGRARTREMHSLVEKKKI